MFNNKISEFDWSCLQEGSVNEASYSFINIFTEFAKLCIPKNNCSLRG